LAVKTITGRPVRGKQAAGRATLTLRKVPPAPVASQPPIKTATPTVPAATNVGDLPLRPPAPKPPSAPLDNVRFFFLWATNSYRPSYRHASLQSALAQAKRLRAAHPDLEIYVFEAVRVDESGVLS
jgi:hypothetical protein